MLRLHFLWSSSTLATGHLSANTKFIPGNVDNRKMSRLDVVHWIESGWKMGKVKKITRTWTKIGIEVFTADV